MERRSLWTRGRVTSEKRRKKWAGGSELGNLSQACPLEESWPGQQWPFRVCSTHPWLAAWLSTKARESKVEQPETVP